jgi:hypothetical protein
VRSIPFGRIRGHAADMTMLDILQITLVFALACSAVLVFIRLGG